MSKHGPLVEFDWLAHYKCNYRCPYCFFEGLWEEVEERNKYLPLAKWKEAWRRAFERNGDMRIIITGGEPFLYPSFSELAGELSGYSHVSFDTNLSCSKEEIGNFTEKVSPENISIGLSFHPLFAGFEGFLEKALLLKEGGYDFRVQYVTYLPQLDRMEHFRDRFVERGLRFVPIPFRGLYQGRVYPDSYTEAEKRMIWGAAKDLEAKEKQWVLNQVAAVRSKGSLCRAGQVYARVDNDGKVYRCGHYAAAGGGVSVGNIFDGNFALLERPFPCELETCPCEFRWLVKEEPG